MGCNLEIKPDVILYDSVNDIDYHKGDDVILMVDGETYHGTIFSLFKNEIGIMLMIITKELRWIGRSVSTTAICILVDKIQEIQIVKNSMQSND